MKCFDLICCYKASWLNLNEEEFVVFFWDSSCFFFGALFFWDSSCFFFGVQSSQNCQMKNCLKPLQWSWNPLILKGGKSPFSFGWSPCMIPPIHVGASSKSILAVGHGVKFLREFKSQNLKTRFAISFVFNNCTAAAATTTRRSTTYLQVVKVQLVFRTTLVWKESVAKTKHNICMSTWWFSSTCNWVTLS